MWVIYGVLGLLGGLTILQAGGTAYFQIIFGIAFLVTDIQVMVGQTSSIVGAGVCCIILGTLSLLGGMTVLSSLGSAGVLIPGWILTLVVLNALLLIVAGILACAGNGPYVAWRTARSHPRPAPQPSHPFTPADGARPLAAALCPVCQGGLRFVPELGAWRCDRCAGGS